MEDDGTTVFAGFTEGSWISANFGGKDFAASKLNVNGTLLWKWQVTAVAACMGVRLLTQYRRLCPYDPKGF